MINILMYINIVFIIVLLVMVFVSRSPWIKALTNRLVITLLVIEVVLYAVLIESSMVLDIAIVFAILGFVDVQFFTVFLRKKGEL